MKKAFLILACFTSSLPALASANAPTEIRTPGSSFMERLAERSYGDFATTFHGPTLQKFGPYSQNARGFVDPKALAGFESELTLAYGLDRDRQSAIGPHIWFFYEPNRADNQFKLQDVGIKFFQKDTIKTENFRLYTSAFVQAPTSEDARERNMLFALRSTPWVMYDIGRTRWRVGSWSDFRYRAGVTSGMMVKAYLQPYVAYRLSDKFAFNLAYETEANHDVGQPDLYFRNIISDFQPGVIWQVTPKIKLTGYALIFPDRGLASKYTGLGATLYTQFL